MKSINEHPEVNKRVSVFYQLKDKGSLPGRYVGRWTGTEWQMRVPYSKDGYEPIEEDIELLGWEE